MPQAQVDPNPEEGRRLSSEEAEKLAAELKKQLKSGDINNADTKQISLMIAGLDDSRGMLRRTFTEGLGKVGESALPFLQKALLTHSSVTVRRAAAKALRLTGIPSALPDLLKALKNDPDAVVQGSAAGAIASFGESGFEFLIEVLRNPKSTAMQCGLAKWGLSFIGSEAREALLKAAQSDHSEIRAAAIAALSEQINSFEDKEAREVLTQALDDNSPEVRAEATSQIGQLGDPSFSFNLLTAKLSDSDRVVRKSAVLALMRIAEPRAIKHLTIRESLETEKEVLDVIKLAKSQLVK